MQYTGEERQNSGFVLPQFFDDGMVLQADEPVRIWGQYPVDGPMSLSIYPEGESAEVVCRGEVKNGFFDITADTYSCGGPYVVQLTAFDGETRIIRDVLFGQVFLCGGQSNMGWSLKQCYNGTMEHLRYQKEIDTSANDEIRGFMIFGEQRDEPAEMLPYSPLHKWEKMSPSTVFEYGAVPYFFAKTVWEKFHVPIGFIQCCIGATSIQSWFPPEVMDSYALPPEDLAKLRKEGEPTGNTPCLWYNGVVHPLRRLAAKGVLWYQGEGNFAGIGAHLGVVSRSYYRYGDYLKAMIEAWRKNFGRPALPFAIVQLPRYQQEGAYFYSREEDKRVCSLVDNAAYSVNIDTGLYPELTAPGDIYNEGHGIHPYVKKTVGVRLAETFMHTFMGVEGLFAGPVLKQVTLGDRSPLLEFERVGDGLKLVGRAGFEVADVDGVFHDAVPQVVDSCHVRLTCEAVLEPTAIRYGYSNYSSLIDRPLTDCSQSVCLYNMKNSQDVPAYPAEQFWVRLY